MFGSDALDSDWDDSFESVRIIRDKVDRSYQQFGGPSRELMDDSFVPSFPDHEDTWTAFDSASVAPDRLRPHGANAGPVNVGTRWRSSYYKGDFVREAASLEDPLTWTPEAERRVREKIADGLGFAIVSSVRRLRDMLPEPKALATVLWDGADYHLRAMGFRNLAHGLEYLAHPSNTASRMLTRTLLQNHPSLSRGLVGQVWRSFRATASAHEPDAEAPGVYYDEWLRKPTRVRGTGHDDILNLALHAWGLPLDGSHVERQLRMASSHHSATRRTSHLPEERGGPTEYERWAVHECESLDDFIERYNAKHGFAAYTISRDHNGPARAELFERFSSVGSDAPRRPKADKTAGSRHKRDISHYRSHDKDEAESARYAVEDLVMEVHNKRNLTHPERQLLMADLLRGAKIKKAQVMSSERRATPTTEAPHSASSTNWEDGDGDGYYNDDGTWFDDDTITFTTTTTADSLFDLPNPEIHDPWQRPKSILSMRQILENLTAYKGGQTRSKRGIFSVSSSPFDGSSPIPFLSELGLTSPLNCYTSNPRNILCLPKRGHWQFKYVQMTIPTDLSNSDTCPGFTTIPEAPTVEELWNAVGIVPILKNTWQWFRVFISGWAWVVWEVNAQAFRFPFFNLIADHVLLATPTEPVDPQLWACLFPYLYFPVTFLLLLYMLVFLCLIPFCPFLLSSLCWCCCFTWLIRRFVSERYSRMEIASRERIVIRPTPGQDLSKSLLSPNSGWKLTGETANTPVLTGGGVDLRDETVLNGGSRHVMVDAAHYQMVEDSTGPPPSVSAMQPLLLSSASSSLAAKTTGISPDAMDLEMGGGPARVRSTLTRILHARPAELMTVHQMSPPLDLERIANMQQILMEAPPVVDPGSGPVRGRTTKMAKADYDYYMTHVCPYQRDYNETQRRLTETALSIRHQYSITIDPTDEGHRRIRHETARFLSRWWWVFYYLPLHRIHPPSFGG